MEDIKLEKAEKFEKSILNNVPFEDIDKMVREDLGKFNQVNKAPKSLTCIFSKDPSLPQDIRHYELADEVIGFVVIVRIDKTLGKYVSFISEVHEDDGNWFAPSKPIYMTSKYIPDM